MRGKSGTARLAQQAGMPIVPIGLWGAHRILTKGRKPHWRWGVAQTAVIGEPVKIPEGEHVKAATDRFMDAISTCVARAREIYPQQPKRRRRPVVGPFARHGDAASEERVTRVAVIGAGSWGTAVAAIAAGNAPTVLWARRDALAERIATDHENTDYLAGVRLPDVAGVDRVARRSLRATPT